MTDAYLYGKGQPNQNNKKDNYERQKEVEIYEIVKSLKVLTQDGAPQKKPGGNCDQDSVRHVFNDLCFVCPVDIPQNFN